MRSVVELYGRHPGADIYVVGTGTSVRVFPLELLAGRITIGLNRAWELYPAQYCITMRPELNIPEFCGAGARPDITWITKPEKFTTPEQTAFAASQPERFFAFRTDGRKCDLPKDQPSQAGRMPEWVREASGPYLYLWSSISQSAMNLAANMGARNVFLIGCDNGPLGGNHHAHQQHTFWKGEDPMVRYRQYEEGCAEVRAALRERGVNVVSLTPFVTLGRTEADFARLCRELGRPEFIHNEDISAQQQMVSGRRSPRPWWWRVTQRLRRLGAAR